MIVRPIKTRPMLAPKDNLISVLEESLPQIEEKTVVVITSKIVSIDEGSCVPMDSISKDDLIIKESEEYIPRNMVSDMGGIHTKVSGFFVKSAGIDESNGNGYYITLPKNPNKSAENIRSWIKEKFGLKDVAVIITDSHSTPLRRGSMGISIGFAGLKPVKDYRQTEDVFGKKLRMSQVNIVDSLASSAVVTMGEGDECTPVAIITDVPNVKFIDKQYEGTKKYSSFIVPEKEDKFRAFFNHLPWKKGGRSEGN